MFLAAEWSAISTDGRICSGRLRVGCRKHYSILILLGAGADGDAVRELGRQQAGSLPKSPKVALAIIRQRLQADNVLRCTSKNHKRANEHCARGSLALRYP